MPYPRFQRARTHKFVKITSGNITLAASASAWADVFTSAASLSTISTGGSQISISAGANV